MPDVARQEAAMRRVHAMDACVIPAEYLAGLRQARWPGRAEVIPDPGSPPGTLTFFLDGAHTVEVRMGMTRKHAWSHGALRRPEPVICNSLPSLR